MKKISRRTFLQTTASLPLTAGLLVGCGNRKEVSVSDDTKTELEGISSEKLAVETQKYRDMLNKAQCMFNEAIRDGELTKREQKRIYDAFQNVDEKAEEIARKAGSSCLCNGAMVDMPLSNRITFNDIGRNLYGLDIDTPEIQKDLSRICLDVEVERVYSWTERLFTLSLGSLFGY